MFHNYIFSKLKSDVNSEYKVESSIASVIWKPIARSYSRRIESVKNISLRRIAYLDGSAISRFSHDYEPIRINYYVPTIDSISIILTYFLFKKSKH